MGDQNCLPVRLKEEMDESTNTTDLSTWSSKSTESTDQAEAEADLQSSGPQTLTPDIGIVVKREVLSEDSNGDTSDKPATRSSKSSKICPYCARTFYHTVALKSHVRKCSRGKARHQEVVLSTSDVIKTELVTETASTSSKCTDDLDVAPGESGNLEPSEFGEKKIEVGFFKGTTFKRECENCGLYFKSVSHARNHVLKKKSYCRRPPHKCKLCGKICKTIRLLIQHEKSKLSCRKWLSKLQRLNGDMQTSVDKDFPYSNVKKIGENDTTSSKATDINMSELGQPEHSAIGNEVNGELKSNTECLYDSGISSESNNNKSVLTCRKCDLNFLNSYRLRKHVLATHRNVSPEGTRTKPSRSTTVAAKEVNSLSLFKCEGGYRCPTCQELFTYPSKLSAHLFRKIKCFPPVRVKTEPADDVADLHSGPINQELHELFLMNPEGGDESANINQRREVLLEGKNSLPTSPKDGILRSLSDRLCSPRMQNNGPNHLVDGIGLEVKREDVSMYQKPSHPIGGTVPFCELCQISFVNRSSLKIHFQKYHESETHNEHSPANSIFGCPFCDRVFESIKSRCLHLRFGHKELPDEVTNFLQQTQCDICMRCFETVSDVQEHVSSVHEKRLERTSTSSTSSDSELKCLHCGQQFTTKHHYSGHINRHCSARKRSLQIPEKLADETPRVERFSPVVGSVKRGKEEFSCEHCHTKFSYKTLYKAHITRYCPVKRKTPSEDATWNCPHCQIAFSKRDLYETHVTKLCLARFSASSNTVADGSPIKNYSCSGCGETCDSRKVLYIHHKTDCPRPPSKTTDKSPERTIKKSLTPAAGTANSADENVSEVPLPFACRGCQKRFRFRHLLYYHQKTVCKLKPIMSRTLPTPNSNGISYICQGCKCVFKSRKVLYAHQKFACVKSGFDNEKRYGAISENVSTKEHLTIGDSKNGATVLPSENGTIYTCRLCDIQFQSRKAMYVHKLSVCSQNEFKKVSSPSELKPHKSGYACKRCSKRCYSRKVLFVHQKFQCKYSKFKTGRLQLLANTSSPSPDETYGQDSSDPRIYQCHRCPEKFVSRKILFVHQKYDCRGRNIQPDEIRNPELNFSVTETERGDLNLEVPDKIRYKCSHCRHGFKDRKNLYAHKKNSCPGPDLTSLENTAKNVDTNAESDLLVGRPLACKFCFKKFWNKKLLQSHYKVSCSVKRSKMREAVAVRSSKDILHVVSSSGDTVPTELCRDEETDDVMYPQVLILEDETEETNTGLDGHVGTKRPFSCKFCSKKFWNLKVLLDHQKSTCVGNRHKTAETSQLAELLSDKQQKLVYPCPYCSRQYCNPFARDRHVRLHAAIKAFRCSYCPQSFTRSDFLTKHLQEEHSEKLRYQCGQCGLKYAGRRSCMQHLNKLHKAVDKKSLIIDLDPLAEEQGKSAVTSHSALLVPKLTLKRTALVRRFKKKKAAWHASESSNFLRVTDDTPGRGIYSCDLCQVGNFTKMSALHRHWRSKPHRQNMARKKAGLAPIPLQDEEVGPIVCSVCRSSFPNVQVFVPHRLSHLNDPYNISDITPYTCEICLSIFTHHQRVQGHLMWHLRVNKNKFVRDVVGQTSSLVPVEILRPVAKKCVSPSKEYNGTVSNNDRNRYAQPAFGPFACEMCSAQYTTRSGVMTHMRRFCPKRFMCMKCGQCFSNSRVLAYHKGRGDCKVSWDQRLKCRYCSLQLNSLEDLGWHEKSCQKVHECEKSGFEAGVSEDQNPANFNCISCKETFTTMAEASSHEETCNPIRSLNKSLLYHCIQCMVCNENFYNPQAVEKHTLTHHTDRFYVRCLPCQKLSNNVKELTDHIAQLSATLAPTDEEKASEHAFEMVNSSQSDSSVLPAIPSTSATSPGNKFSCLYCPRVFRDCHNLKLHTVIHQSFTCPVCNKVETTKEGFRVHPCLLEDGSYATGLMHRIPIHQNMNPLVHTLSSDLLLEPISESDNEDQGCVEPLPSTSGVTTVKSVEDAELVKLRGNFSQLLFFLVADPELMTRLGWGQKLIDTVLEDVLVHLGEEPVNTANASRDRTTDFDRFRDNVRRFLSISIKEDVLSTVDKMSHSSIGEMVANMLGMCTETGES